MNPSPHGGDQSPPPQRSMQNVGAAQNDASSHQGAPVHHGNADSTNDAAANIMSHSFSNMTPTENMTMEQGGGTQGAAASTLVGATPTGSAPHATTLMPTTAVLEQTKPANLQSFMHLPSNHATNSLVSEPAAATAANVAESMPVQPTFAPADSAVPTVTAGAGTSTMETNSSPSPPIMTMMNNSETQSAAQSLAGPSSLLPAPTLLTMPAPPSAQNTPLQLPPRTNVKKPDAAAKKPSAPLILPHLKAQQQAGSIAGATTATANATNTAPAKTNPGPPQPPLPPHFQQAFAGRHPNAPPGSHHHHPPPPPFGMHMSFPPHPHHGPPPPHHAHFNKGPPPHLAAAANRPFAMHHNKEGAAAVTGMMRQSPIPPMAVAVREQQQQQQQQQQPVTGAAATTSARDGPSPANTNVAASGPAPMDIDEAPKLPETNTSPPAGGPVNAMMIGERARNHNAPNFSATSDHAVAPGEARAVPSSSAAVHRSAPAIADASVAPPPLPHRPSVQPQPQPQDAHQQANNNNNNANGGQWRELRVEDALNYLDHVKMEFKDRPKVYNQFLAIMKNFKSQEVDTPGVIRMVSKLFRGYNNLILGFNTFLPDGYKISLADLERQEEEERQREANEAAAAAGVVPPVAKPAHNIPRGPPRPQPAYAAANAARQPYEQQAGSMQLHQKQSQVPMDNRKPAPQAGPQPKEAHGQVAMQQHQPQRSPPQQQPQHQAVEFDHAISYVTKIKRRFANDPSTYHKFLEILHTYQKEQRGIKEVLEQVAHLFQDHPDLLKEFTFFLPDAVQEQAKERLHRAAAESESRIAKAQQDYHNLHGARPAQVPHPPSHNQLIDMTRSQQLTLTEGTRKRSFDAAAGNETVVYNSAVERQFFDAAREALTSYSRDGGQAWAEFIKCLDMYAQDILSRKEMLDFVEPLLGKRNTKLFEEFKRILNAAGSPTHPLPFMEDSWHSVPLSEIDFSRCRRCSPSYRALPRDYPAPPCGDRSEEERMVLNDIWVSLPVGSEESYTFRHMRRNTYEETLFRVEDERFEIDMAIDTNAATLHRLEPIAEEIALLSQEDPTISDLGSKVDGTGLGGKRFQYSFDRSILGVIHRNSITRIYGDGGAEVLELMYKNPTVAIPLVVERLRQKAVEWRAVRDRLNRNWKELAQLNYYKSLDHRGLTWRAVDKRITSARAIVLEIKDRALHGGKEGPEALKQKLDKAKEEHGAFYEVTMKGELSKSLDLTFLPRPDRRLFTPHLSVMYENNSWAQRDAYRILAFALERGPTTPGDKERCHRLWIEFFGPFFGLDLSWMERPAVTYMESHTAPNSDAPVTKATVVSDNDDDEIMQDANGKGITVVTEELRQNGGADASGRDFTDYHPLPPGAHVSTLYGQGRVIEFRRSDHIYVVQLQFGAVGYLRPATVLCSILPVEKSAYTRELCSSDFSKLARPGDQLAMGTQSLYLFFYLHQILIRRLNIAKRLAYEVGEDESLKTLVEQMPNSNKNAVGRRRYEAFLSLVYGLLDGGVGGPSEGEKYEDRLRGLLGHGSYELATIDKLVAHIWKNIQQMAGDETMWNLVQLYRRHLKSTTGFQPEAFRQEAAYQSEGEPMYAFQYCAMTGQDKAVLHMEYVGVMEDENDESDEDEDSASVDGRLQEPVVLVEPTNKRPRR